MAQNLDVNIQAKVWTQITNADLSTGITLQNKGTSNIKLKATTGTTAPTDSHGSLIMERYSAIKNTTIADLFPGLALGKRLWVYCDLATNVLVSHA